jgi:hypothetical protein
MTWVTFIWGMIVSACLTLVVVHLPMRWRRRRETPLTNAEGGGACVYFSLPVIRKDDAG